MAKQQAAECIEIPANPVCLWKSDSPGRDTQLNAVEFTLLVQRGFSLILKLLKW